MNTQGSTPARYLLSILALLFFLTGCTTTAVQAEPSSEQVDDFLTAIQALQIEKVKTMVSDNKNLVNKADGGGALPLMVAIIVKPEPSSSNEKLEMVKYLLSQGADPNKEEASGILPLESALLADIEIVKALLEAGADPFKESTGGFTPFEAAKGLQGPDAAKIQALFEEKQK